MKKIIAAAAIATAVSFSGVAPALADGYNANDPVDVDYDTATPGMTLKVKATGFKAGSTVTVKLRTGSVSLGTATADANGAVSIEVDLPADLELGSHFIDVSGDAPDGSARKVSAEITVLDELPNTGSNGAMPVVLLGSILAGAGAVLVVRRNAKS